MVVVDRFTVYCIHLITHSPRDDYSGNEFCESYDAAYPTVILFDWFKGDKYQHLVIHTRNCVLGLEYLKTQPTPVYCHLLSRCQNVTYDQTNGTDFKETLACCDGKDMIIILSV